MSRSLEISASVNASTRGGFGSVRVTESFAKWALGDIGVNLEIGYKVPPPSAPLDVWGAPLARLAASG